MGGKRESNSQKYKRTYKAESPISSQQALGFVGSNRLLVAPFKLSTPGGRAFPVAAVRLSNNLPEATEAHYSILAYFI